jgi:alpha-galactosidase
MYTKLVDDVAAVLADPGKYYPDYDGRKVELAGLVWFQGWNDFVLQEYVAQYETNMVHLIHDVRSAWGVSELPFVVAETGNACAKNANSRGLATCAAQKAVTELPEFAGQAAYVRTRDYYFDRHDSPYDNATHHWRGNFQSFYLIGNDMGKAMLPLLEKGAD